MPAPVSDISTALFTGLTAGLIALIAALPAILGALAILILGWIVSGIVAGLVARALRAVRVDGMADRAGLTAALRRAQVHATISGILAGVTKWYLRLIFVLMAADAVKLTAVSTIVNEVLAFVPNLVVAAAILAVFAWLAGLARNVVTGALQPSMANASSVGVLAYVATFGFGVIAAATQIGVATALVDILFAGIIAGLALAFGLAFGLGGREEAAHMWRGLRGSMGTVAVPHEPAPAREAPVPAADSGNGRPHAPEQTVRT
jgi:mechanosensitive ion channel-like protein